MANGSIISNAQFGLGLLASFGPRVDVVGIYANGAGNGPAATSSLTSSVINSITGNSNVTASFGQMFPNARPLKARVRPTSRVMEHPTEVGVMLADHKVINPLEIDIPLMISAEFYAATYNQIRQAWLNSTPLTIKTRVGVFSNMVIANMPHDEDPDFFDVITLLLHLRQAQFVIPGSNAVANNYQPLDPLNANTIANGLQSAAALGGQLVAAAGSIASYAALVNKRLI